jgi:hypothetical protein
VKLNLQASMMRLNAELMDRYVIASGHGPYTIEDAFRPGFAGNGVDDYICRGQGSVCSKVNRRGRARVRSAK